MSDIQVGDVRRFDDGDTNFVILRTDGSWFKLIYPSGDTEEYCDGELIWDIPVRTVLIKHYDTWYKAVNSKEFQKEYKD